MNDTPEIKNDAPENGNEKPQIDPERLKKAVDTLTDILKGLAQVISSCATRIRQKTDEIEPHYRRISHLAKHGKKLLTRKKNRRRLWKLAKRVSDSIIKEDERK